MLAFIILYNGGMNEAVGETIRELRKRHHLSQERFADLIDSHQVYVSEIEKGKKLPSLTVLHKIAGAFGMSLSELVAQIEARIVQDARDES